MTASELEKRTQQFWQLSLYCNGRERWVPRPSTEQVMRNLRYIIINLNADRPLSLQACELLTNIIVRGAA